MTTQQDPRHLAAVTGAQNSESGTSAVSVAGPVHTHQVGALFTPGGVHELRIPKAGRYRTISGYFDDPVKLAAEAARWDGAGFPGIYFTVNPAKPELLARAANRAKTYADTTTSDHSIACRRWFIVDLDPEREAGISSTNDEHTAAFDKALEIAGHLEREGWPGAVLMDSGNGYYLLYRVDLPNDDESRDLVERCLKALAHRFNGPVDDGPAVKVDTTMFNAARIIRVPGTTNRKGDDTPDRPHRVCHIVHVPNPLEVVDRDLLETLAAQAPDDTPAHGTRVPSGNVLPFPRQSRDLVGEFMSGRRDSFDLDSFIAEHFPDADGPKVRGSIRKWVLKVCPFNDDHTDRSAFILQLPNGAISAGCQHDSCKRQWNWHTLRAKLDPAYAERRPELVGAAAAVPVVESSDGGVEQADTEASTLPALEIPNPADAHWWLREHVGTGPLAGMFRRGKLIVHTPLVGEEGYRKLTDDERDDDGPAQVTPVDADYLAAAVDTAYRCFRWKRNRSGEIVGAEHVLFPKEAAVRVVRGTVETLPNLRPLVGVVHTPILREDGSILDTPGYDEDTKLLYLPEPGVDFPPVPERPTPEQVRTAVSLVTLPIAEFPFVSVHDRANYLGAMLTPLLQAMVPPPYKLLAVEARQPGSGKTFLANMLRALHGGVFRGEMPGTEEEIRKQITAILATTTGPVVVIDNVTGTFRSSHFASLLTAGDTSDRTLGKTEFAHCVNDRLWVITGNNVSIGGDLPRRTIRVTIDPRCPHPERRTGFTIPAPVKWVAAHRGELIAALLTIIRSWVVAGRPLGDEAGSDDFADWVRTVRGILAHAGVEGVFDHESTRVDIGEDDAELRDFYRIGWKVFGNHKWFIKDLIDKVDDNPYVPGVPQMPRANKPIPLDALPSELLERDRWRKPKSFGRWVTYRRGRWAGDLCIELAAETPQGNMWRFVHKDEVSPGGSD